MNIKEAAEYLGVSVKTLERRVAAGDISVAYVPGQTGKQRTFEHSELDRFKQAEEEKAAATTYVARPRVAPVASDASLVSRNGGSEALALVLKNLVERLPAPENGVPQMSVTDLAHKLTLSLVEAAQLSGLSRNHLREAIEEKKLKARIIGRGFRVKREDLSAYVKKL